MKLPTIKSLEAKVWGECRRVIRKIYPNTCYTCGKKNLIGKDLNTGHFVKKGILPFQLKYDLRILRNQCLACNKYKNGNESFYAIQLLINEGADHILNFYDEFKMFKEEKLDTKQKRIFLENLINKYINM